MNAFKKIITPITLLTVLTASMSDFSLLAGAEQYEIQPEDKISSELQDMMISTTDKIPVVVWLNNLNDDVVEQRIKDSIGFNLSELDSTYIPPSNALLKELAEAANGDACQYLNILMRNHLKLNEIPRAIEKAKTDAYLSARADIFEEMNTLASDKILNKMNISEEDVHFVSKYAPMIICALTPDEINSTSEFSEINELDLFIPLDYVDCTPINFGTTKTTMGITPIAGS